MSVRVIAVTAQIKRKQLPIGATVKHRISGELGTVRWSVYGVKIVGEFTDGMRWETQGHSAEKMAKSWEVIDDEKNHD